MNFKDQVKKLGDYAAAGDGAMAASLFTEEGVYHDAFYGSFQGREKISELFEQYFHRDGENYIWDFHDPVSDGAIGYARYIFSYDSKVSGAVGRRAVFEGASIFRLQNGLFSEYHEVANVGTCLVMMDFAPERIKKLYQRHVDSLRKRSECAAHFNR